MCRRLRVLGAVTVVALGAGTLGACEPPGRRTTFEDDAAVPGKITAVRLDLTTNNGDITVKPA
jgi:hypothetical protein